MRAPLTYYGGKQKLGRHIVALMPAIRATRSAYLPGSW